MRYTKSILVISCLQLRPPQPAVYLYVLDVSFNAVSTGYLSVFCQTLLDELDRVPGDARTQIGFITVDSSVHFYNLAEGLSQPQMYMVSDVEGWFMFRPREQGGKARPRPYSPPLVQRFEENTELAFRAAFALSQ